MPQLRALPLIQQSALFESWARLAPRNLRILKPAFSSGCANGVRTRSRLLIEGLTLDPREFVEMKPAKLVTEIPIKVKCGRARLRPSDFFHIWDSKLRNSR